MPFSKRYAFNPCKNHVGTGLAFWQLSCIIKQLLKGQSSVVTPKTPRTPLHWEPVISLSFQLLSNTHCQYSCSLITL